MHANELLTRILLAAQILLVAATAHASPFLVTLDTSPLSGTATLVLGLTNFDAASNTVSLSAFDFGGGSLVAGSEDCTLGGAFSGLGCSGNLATGVVLEDLDPAGAFFTQQFTPGSSLSFVLTTTNNHAGGVPDQFAMSLCDGSLSTCYSDDATGAMLLLDLMGGSLSPSSLVRFGAENLDAPVVTVTTAVPEPGTLLLLAVGLAGLVARRASPSGRRRGLHPKE
jgi:hypothetical protein